MSKLFHIPSILLCTLAAWFVERAELYASDPDLELRLRQTVETLAGVGSRVTGYPGCDAAAEILKDTLRALGVTEVYAHRFPVPIPLDQGFRLEAGGQSVRLYGVWPNLVRTSTLPPEGIEGSLVYAAGGDLKALEGRKIAGQIVLIHYASGRRWVDLFHLGAQAVIFLEKEGAHRKEAEQKFLDVPADLPRFYAPAADTARLIGLARSGARVRLSGQMPWRSAVGQTLVGVIEGSDPTLGKEAVLLGASYDAISPVPALAPGAEQACGVAGLLELVREFSIRPPRRTVVLVLTAGHFENLAGMRHFVPLLQAAAGRRHPGREWTPDGAALIDRLSLYKVRMFVGLDLSSGSDLIGVHKPVAPYRVRLLAPPITARLIGFAAAYEDAVLDGRPMLANGLKQDVSRQALGGIPQTIPFDASVASLAGCPSLVFCTVNDSRAGIDSPVDRPANVSIRRLARQVAFLTYLIPRLINDPDLEAWEWGKDAFGTVRGQVVHYGLRSYLPDRPTGGALVRVRLRNPTLSGVRADFWAAADDSGRFQIPGVEAKIIYTQPVRLEAYRVDAATGMVTDAPD